MNSILAYFLPFCIQLRFHGLPCTQKRWKFQKFSISSFDYCVCSVPVNLQNTLKPCAVLWSVNCDFIPFRDRKSTINLFLNGIFRVLLHVSLWMSTIARTSEIFLRTWFIGKFACARDTIECALWFASFRFDADFQYLICLLISRPLSHRSSVALLCPYELHLFMFTFRYSVENAEITISHSQVAEIVSEQACVLNSCKIMISFYDDLFRAQLRKNK